MKIKKVFGILSLLCSMPLAFSANSFANVVCAADAETEMAIVQEDGFDYILGEGVTYNYASNKTENKKHDPFSSNWITMYGGDYLETEFFGIKGGTKIDLNIRRRVYPHGDRNYKSDEFKLTFEVYDSVTNTLKNSFTFIPSSNALATENKSDIMTIQQDGVYYLKISSNSNSSASRYTKIYQTSITYTPYVAAPEEPDVGDPVLPDQRTLSQMAFSYSKDDEGAYNIGDVVLRYGAVLPYVDWSALDINAYGVALTKSSNLEGSLSDLIGSADLSDPSARAGFDKVSFAMGDMDNVARVNADGDLFVEDAEGEYVLFNARLVVPSSNYDTEINAVAFVVVAGKTVLFEEVVRDSVASQARYYLDNGSYSGDVLDVLNILAA